MSQPRQRLKEKLARRDFTLGIHAKYSDADLVEAIAPHCDFVFIDCENAGPDVQTIPNLARAARAGGAAALLRPWSKEAGVLRRYLGCGIDGFILPDIESAEEVARVRKDMADVLPTEADGLVLIALLETVKGIDNAKAIMTAPGTDAIQIGTSDLSASLGLPRRGDYPQVRDIAFKVIAEAKVLGMSAGCPVNKFGMKPVLDAGASCVLLFMADVLAAGIADVKRDWPK
ncbi:MAG: aldolase/citrate lyase family protein [Pseudorhodoplanes sp.]